MLIPHFLDNLFLFAKISDSQKDDISRKADKERGFQYSFYAVISVRRLNETNVESIVFLIASKVLVLEVLRFQFLLLLDE